MSNGEGESSSQEEIDINISNFSPIIAGVMILVAFFLVGSQFYQVVPPGTEGYKVTLGDVHDQELEPGLHLKKPFITSVDQLSTRTEAYTMSGKPGEGTKADSDSIEALTREGLNIEVDLTVRYHMNEGNAPRVYSNIGDQRAIQSKIVRPTIRSSVRSCSAKFSVNGIYSDKREQFSDCIANSTTDQFQEVKGFDVEKVQLRNVMLPNKVSSAIQEKEAAQQRIETKENQIQVEKMEKKRKIVEAQGIARSNQIIGSSLSKQYLSWYWIQEGLKKGDALYITGNPAQVPGASGLPQNSSAGTSSPLLTKDIGGDLGADLGNYTENQEGMYEGMNATAQ